MRGRFVSWGVAGWVNEGVGEVVEEEGWEVSNPNSRNTRVGHGEKGSWEGGPVMVGESMGWSGEAVDGISPGGGYGGMEELGRSGRRMGNQETNP